MNDQEKQMKMVFRWSSNHPIHILFFIFSGIVDFMMKLWRSTGNVIYFHVLGGPNVLLINPEDIEVSFKRLLR